ncbi:MAG: flagellar basal body rod protein FlgB [Clostridia bacterium]|nr:flagellar basal body rod protein FlgB [Clostridia bacterium]MDD4798284.1 flagellar basal body rod protein FlgB [Clostridia bacterium]
MQRPIDTNSLLITQKSLDVLWMKQKVISNNIANADTPGFKSSNVVFEDILKNTLSSSGSSEELQQKLLSLEPQILKDNSIQVREDGNNVDLDEQNIELTRVRLQYETMARVISEEFSRMQYVIRGGN